MSREFHNIEQLIVAAIKLDFTKFSHFPKICAPFAFSLSFPISRKYFAKFSRKSLQNATENFRIFSHTFGSLETLAFTSLGVENSRWKCVIQTRNIGVVQLRAKTLLISKVERIHISIMASVTYGKHGYDKCNYGKCFYGKLN